LAGGQRGDPRCVRLAWRSGRHYIAAGDFEHTARRLDRIAGEQQRPPRQNGI
jgi:hypothetical protein